MIKFYFLILTLFLSTGIVAQQINNGNMEDWDDLGSSSEEPSNWNSFMSATGGLAFSVPSKLSSQQMFHHHQRGCIVLGFFLKVLLELSPMGI